MKEIMLFASLLFLGGVCDTSAGGSAPKGWMLSGSRSKAYSAELDVKNKYEGHSILKYASKENAGNGFGTIMQIISADKYKGKRVRWSGYVKSDGLKDWAGLWMRVDDKKDKPLAFDNMRNRFIQGTLPWKKYSVVLDIPAKGSSAIAFGFLISGNGTVWLSGFSFEIVDKTVPVTDSGMDFPEGVEIPDQPVNLDFK